MADEYLSEAFIKSLHARVVSMEGNLAENTTATQQNTEAIKRVESNTLGLVEMFSALEGGFKVLSAIGRVAKPVFYTVSACTALYGLWTTFGARFLK